VVDKYKVLLSRLKRFLVEKGGEVRGGGATTKEILKEFKDVPNGDAAIFKNMLRDLAKLEKGRWRLK
jgi:hypothetical protein